MFNLSKNADIGNNNEMFTTNFKRTQKKIFKKNKKIYMYKKIV